MLYGHMDHHADAMFDQKLGFVNARDLTKSWDAPYDRKTNTKL